MPGCTDRKIINNLTFRLHYYGCDLISLPSISDSRSLLSHPRIKLINTAGQVLVRSEKKLFYVNKDEGIAQEVKLPKNLRENDGSLTLEKIKNIADEINFPHLHTRAKIVTDIEVLLTAEERRQALRKLDDDNINFKNTSYTYALQVFLARYNGESWHEQKALEKEIKEESAVPKPWWRQIFTSNKQAKLKKIHEMRAWADNLHTLSAEFKRLEKFVNNAAGDPDLVMEKFNKDLQESQENLLAIIKKIKCNTINSKWQKKLLTNLENKLQQNYTNFSKTITEIGAKPNKDALDCLLSSADRSLTIKSLGTYLCEQTSDILDTGIKGAYKISDNRLKDVLQVPRLVAYLSDAKQLFLIKGLSIAEGPKDNDTYSPIPEAMLASITEITELDNTDQHKQWFSLTPYLKKWRPNYIDEVLCLLTDKSRDANDWHGNYLYHFLWQPLKIIASIVEIGFAIPRLLIVISLGLIETGLSLLPSTSATNSAKITWRINQFISDFYDKFAILLAPLTYMQRSEFNRYKRTDPENGEQHQEIIDECADYNTYCHKLFVYFTPQLIVTYIQDFFLSFVASFANFAEDIKYLLAPTSKNQDVYDAIKVRQELYTTITKNLSPEKPEFNPDNEEAELPTTSYAKIAYCKENAIVSPLDVFYEIAVTLSNDIINPMFRKSPGIATFYFMLSFLTFGTFVLPASTFAWMNPVPIWLQYLANQISLHFTGKAASAGVMEQMISCFLGWKLGFFSTEFVAEMLEGHYEILEKIFEEPEKIVLGFVGLVGVGMALQFVPELPTNIDIPGIGKVPNFYFIIINAFTEEAKACAAGTIGLNALEYGFLGLKFAMLFHSMIAGSEHTELDKNEIEQFIYELHRNNKLVDINNFVKNLEADANEKTILNHLNNIKDENNLSIKTSTLKYIASKLYENNLEPIPFPTDTLEPEPTKEKQATQQPSYEEAKQALDEAIELCMSEQRLMFSPSLFGVNKEAHQFYDHLDKLFNDYNNAVKKEYPNEIRKLQIDKRPFLDVFYNKYIYRRSNNFIRSLLLIFYPITVLSRSLKYLWATLTNKPSMQHQIIKNFCKDVVIISQIFTPVALMLSDFGLYISGVLRGVAFLIVTPLSALIYPFVQAGNYLFKKEVTPFQDWFTIIDETICKYIALHKTPALQPIRQLIVRAARIAGTNSDLGSAREKIKTQLINQEGLDLDPNRETAVEGTDQASSWVNMLPELEVPKTKNETFSTKETTHNNQIGGQYTKKASPSYNTSHLFKQSSGEPTKVNLTKNPIAITL